jgi:hypothetical protein
LTSLGAPATAILAVAGAAWYGLLSLGAAIAYVPLGVRPRETGLSSSTVLTQSAIGVVAAVAVFIVVQTALRLLVGTAKGNGSPARSPIGVLASAALGVWVVAGGIVLQDSVADRSAMKDGRKPGSVIPGLLNPWGGEIATLAWSNEEPPGFGDLPSCALYLGEAESTAVVYDPEEKRVLRIPTSTLIVTTRPEDDSC